MNVLTSFQLGKTYWALCHEPRKILPPSFAKSRTDVVPTRRRHNNKKPFHNLCFVMTYRFQDIKVICQFWTGSTKSVCVARQEWCGGSFTGLHSKREQQKHLNGTLQGFSDDHYFHRQNGCKDDNNKKTKPCHKHWNHRDFFNEISSNVGSRVHKTDNCHNNIVF